jgi:hypothetical protein
MGDFYNGISQIRVIELLNTGATDPSATAITSTIPKKLSEAPVYKDGEELEQTGGGEIVCTITEEDAFKGIDLKLNLASLDYEAKKVIAGGDLVMDGPDVIGWESSDTKPGPFAMEAWIPHYSTDEAVEGMEDGYLKLTYPFCKGRIDDRDHEEKGWGEDSFTIKARQNPSSGDGAKTEEIVDTIV